MQESLFFYIWQPWDAAATDLFAQLLMVLTDTASAKTDNDFYVVVRGQKEEECQSVAEMHIIFS